MAPTPSLHRHYPASFHVLGLLVAAILCVVPTSQSHRHSSPLRLVRAYLWRRNWMSRRTRNCWDLTGCFMNIVCSAIVASDPGSPTTARQIVVVDIAFNGSDRLGRIQENMHFGAQYHSRPGRQPSPFDLTTFLCTLQRGCYQTRCNTRYWASGYELPRRESHPLVHKPFPVRSGPAC